LHIGNECDLEDKQYSVVGIFSNIILYNLFIM